MIAELYPVPGFRCSVTADGRVFSRGSRQGERELKGWADKDGYRRVNVHNGERFQQVPVHLLVALTFLGPRPSPEHEVAHGDGVNTHNHKDNLRWATTLENQHDRALHGTVSRGEDQGSAKLTDDQVREIRRRYRRGSKTAGASALAREFGVSHFAVHRIVTGKGWKHVGQQP